MNMHKQVIERAVALLKILNATGVVVVDGVEIYSSGAVKVVPAHFTKSGQPRRAKNEYIKVYGEPIKSTGPGETCVIAVPESADYHVFTNAARSCALRAWGEDNVIHERDKDARTITLLRVL